MSDETKTFTLNRPEGMARDEFLQLWQFYQMRLAELVSNAGSKFDPAIPRLVRFMISLVPHDKIRWGMENDYDQAIEVITSMKKISLDERNDMIIKIAASTAGELTSYIDQYKGLAHQLKVGELVAVTQNYFANSYKEVGDPDSPIEMKSGKVVIKRMIKSVVPAVTEVITESETVCEPVTDDGGQANDVLDSTGTT